MTGYLRLFSLAVILLSGCSSYETVTIRKTVVPPERLVLSGTPDMEEGDEKEILTELRYCESQRYLATRGSSEAASKILETGVREAVAGNLFEAGILFLELRGRESNGSAENNLGVVYEKSGRYTEAYGMYTAAVQMNPDSGLYRKNLYYFIASGGLSQKTVTEKKRK